MTIPVNALARRAVAVAHRLRPMSKSERDDECFAAKSLIMAACYAARDAVMALEHSRVDAYGRTPVTSYILKAADELRALDIRYYLPDAGSISEDRHIAKLLRTADNHARQPRTLADIRHAARLVYKARCAWEMAGYVAPDALALLPASLADEPPATAEDAISVFESIAASLHRA